MPRVPLVEHERPRILAVDFSRSSVKKLETAGLNVKKAATGLYDPGKVCIPSAVQDAEIILFECSKGSLDKIGERPIAEESVLDGPYFRALIHEVWKDMVRQFSSLKTDLPRTTSQV